MKISTLRKVFLLLSISFAFVNMSQAQDAAVSALHLTPAVHHAAPGTQAAPAVNANAPAANVNAPAVSTNAPAANNNAPASPAQAHQYTRMSVAPAGSGKKPAAQANANTNTENPAQGSTPAINKANVVSSPNPSAVHAMNAKLSGSSGTE